MKPRALARGPFVPSRRLLANPAFEDFRSDREEAEPAEGLKRQSRRLGLSKPERM